MTNDTKVNSVGFWQACMNSNECTASSCPALYYTLAFDFSQYDATSKGAPSVGQCVCVRVCACRVGGAKALHHLTIWSGPLSSSICY